MTSTSKSGMVVTSSIHVVPRTMQATQVEREVARELSEPEQEVSWATVLKCSVAFALMFGGGAFVLWALMKGALWLTH